MEVLNTTGTRAKILQAIPVVHPQNGETVALQLLLSGLEIVQLEKVLNKGPPLQVQIAQVAYEDDGQDQEMLKATVKETMQTVKDIMKVNPSFREYAAMINQQYERMMQVNPHMVAHFAASMTTAEAQELQKVLEATNAQDKLRIALELLKKELELSKLQQKIANQIEEKMSKHQREFMLREQLKQIKKELGIDKDDGSDTLLQKFKERLEGKTLPKEVQEAIDSEVDKFSNLAKESQEYQITRNYLDWLTGMPWGVYSKDTFDLKKAREILDRDHYGLSDIKDRIREFIAVGVLKGSMQGKILCFVGPPGVGKTSIGKSIAEALGREFHRFSVGGLYDVAEIKGHRRTYVGAMPGKVIQCLKKLQTSNPLILIDEVDKIGRGHQGDPASALLELLDPSQNFAFNDHYLDVPVDCSNILFVCTANVLDTIPGPLLDRMEVIRLTGYDLQEKMKIAEDYLVPTALEQVGLKKPEAEEAKDKSTESSAIKEAKEARPLPEVKAEIESSALEALIRWYCREAGVRNLQKHIERICRKIATKVVERWEGEAEADAAAGGAGGAMEIRVDEAALSDYVGKPVFTSDRLYEDELPPGTVTGLAWTAMGGSVLYIEATALPRRKKPDGDAAGGPSVAVPPTLAVTGQLGSVMKESSQIALLVARRQLATRQASGFFEEHELFLHCPEGATPKDGPSAGVTMTTALLSVAMDKPIPTDLAMTGEVSLNGKVLAVGGIKEKTIAARRAGCKTLVFPAANRRDFDELPKYLQEDLEVHFASHFNEVFDIAFRAMQLFVREVTGASLSVAADGFDTVAALKERLALLQAVPADEQRLLFGGRSLSDAEVLAACGLEDESTVFLSMDLSGGGKKRKKKTYTKPKKIKHKRKKVKLSVLKFYKVDSNDKVTRLRRECPQETCGSGVFMAMHFNRYYCP
ncbi:unnamed protein product [Effrenium voratum]|uniref:Lon protease homolog n=1 Tax=Effrenium voratum TaxID=2562239 RepID=A0AA36NF19_9DINO|nr:unnamed protein product [Effrenium voratum]